MTGRGGPGNPGNSGNARAGANAGDDPASLRYAVVRALREDLDRGRAPAGVTVTTDDVAAAVEAGNHLRYAGLLGSAYGRRRVRTELYRLESVPEPAAPAVDRLEPESGLRRTAAAEWLVLPYLYGPLFSFEVERGCYKPCPACGLTGPHCYCDDATAVAALDERAMSADELAAVRDTRRRAKAGFPA